MGDMWWAPLPRCPVHGQMRADLDSESWRCAGFDGEGCAYVVPAAAADWQPFGKIDDLPVLARSELPKLPPLELPGTPAAPPPPERLPWADPGHDVAADIRVELDAAGMPAETFEALFGNRHREGEPP